MRAPFLYVYTAAIPTTVGVEAVFPSSRSEEISSCASQKAQKEKFCVWKLLEYALWHACKKDMRDISFRKSANGKWECDFCYFSLSHSENGVAVALSDSPVGIDIEKIAPVKNREKVAKKILTETEFAEYQRLVFDTQTANDFLLELWTKKESMFKRGGYTRFSPLQISADGETATKRIVLAEEEFFLSVSGKAVEKAVWHNPLPFL